MHFSKSDSGKVRKICRFVNDVLHSGERKKDGIGRLPVERAHGEIVVLSLPNSKLLFEVCKGIKTAARIETLLVLAVAALYLAIVSRGVRPDELMTDAKLLRGRLEQGR